MNHQGGHSDKLCQRLLLSQHAGLDVHPFRRRNAADAVNNQILDNDNANTPYTRALRQQIEKIHHPELTASARMLSAMRTQKMSVTELALQKSHEYTRYFQKSPLDAAIKKNFDLQVKTSLAEQKQLDATNEIPFDKYLSNYFSQDDSASIIHSQILPKNLPDRKIETAAQ